VPAIAVVEAEVNSRTSVLELDPIFSDRTPVASVKVLMSLERVDIRVPRLDSTVSSLSSVVNCVFHGVSTFCRFATIEDTVAVTSNPSPLVGDPKLSPILIAPSFSISSSRISNQH
jgi:hypothetical protein